MPNEARHKAALLAALASPLIFLTPWSARAAEANRLTTAKVIYVEPMPGGLDQWFIQDLRAWGKYRIAGSEEGVDLVVKAEKPQPRFTRHRTPPALHRKRKEPPILSVEVVDWVTGGLLWQADVLNAGEKKDQAPSTGPETEVDARHMKPDEIAERATNLLRRYVDGLESQQGARKESF